MASFLRIRPFLIHQSTFLGIIIVLSNKSPKICHFYPFLAKLQPHNIVTSSQSYHLRIFAIYSVMTSIPALLNVGKGWGRHFSLFLEFITGDHRFNLTSWNWCYAKFASPCNDLVPSTTRFREHIEKEFNNTNDWMGW